MRHKREFRKLRKPGRKERPWLSSPIKPLHYSSYLYARHQALMEALTPYVLADLQERIEIAVIKGEMQAAKQYQPTTVGKPDIFLYALEFVCRKLHLDIEQIVNEFIAKQQKELLKDVILGKGD